MQIPALQSWLTAWSSAEPSCLYTAWSSAGAVTSLEQAVEMVMWAEGVKNSPFLRTERSNRLPISAPPQPTRSVPFQPATSQDLLNLPWEEIVWTQHVEFGQSSGSHYQQPAGTDSLTLRTPCL